MSSYPNEFRRLSREAQPERRLREAEFNARFTSTRAERAEWRSERENARIEHERRMANEASGYVSRALDAAREAATEGYRGASIEVTDEMSGYVSNALRGLGFKRVREESSSWTQGDLDGNDYSVRFRW